MSENQRLYGIFRGIETKLFYQGFLSQTMAIHRTAGGGGVHFYFSDICNFACKMIMTYF